MAIRASGGVLTVPARAPAVRSWLSITPTHGSDGKPDAHNGTIRGATGTTPWTHYEFELPVGKTASTINFGALMTGTGTAWVDAMKVELDGEPYSNPQLDFDFESPTATGFLFGCGSASAICTGYKYKVGIDDTVSYSGHQSLKMQFVRQYERAEDQQIGSTLEQFDAIRPVFSRHSR